MGKIIGSVLCVCSGVYLELLGFRIAKEGVPSLKKKNWEDKDIGAPKKIYSICMASGHRVGGRGTA